MGKKFGANQVEKQLAGVPLRSGPPVKNAGKPNAKGAEKSSFGRVAKGGPQRLQRLLASAGYGSRRHCEELIRDGRVEVEGLDVIELGTQVDPQTAKVFVDGNLLRQQRLVYFLLNKPPGVVTSNKDPQGRTLVVDLIQEPERVFPVGRLDRNSEGLILLTNDGDLAQQLAHPKFGVRKIYRVTVAGKIDGEKLSRMKQGIYIAEGHVAVDGAKILKHRAKSTELEIVLREGKNREIRRILARLGHKVMTLQRVAIGPLRLGELPRGAYRPLKGDELRRLREEVFYQSRAAKTGKSGDDVVDEDEAANEAPDNAAPETETRSRTPRSKETRSKETRSTAGSDRAKTAKVKPAKRAGAGFKSSSSGPKSATRKGTAQKGAASKGSGPKKGTVSRQPVRKKSSQGKYGLDGLDLGLEGSKRVGTVIGDDAPPRKQLEKKPARKNSGKKSGGSKKVLKRSTKKSDSNSIGKPSIKRKKG